ncbi:MAG: hypothetical protein AAGH40_06375 [Verrucomicrobiota bacterium]
MTETGGFTAGRFQTKETEFGKVPIGPSVDGHFLDHVTQKMFNGNELMT